MCTGAEPAAASSCFAADTAAAGAEAGAGAAAADSLGGAAALEAGTELGAGTIAADSLGGAAALEAGTSATLGGLDTAGTAAAGATATESIPEVLIQGTNPAAAATSATDLPGFALPGALGAGGMLLPSGGGPSPQAVREQHFTPAAGDAGSIPAALDAGGGPSLDQALSDILTGGGATPGFDVAGLPDSFSVDPAMQDISVDPGSPLSPTQPGALDSFEEWIKQPKNALTAASLGLTAKNALFPPKLPSAARGLQGPAESLARSAQATIQSGGFGSPLWATQKAGIDARIDQQIQNETAAIQQSMANAGMGGANSGIVQEQIATVTAKLNAEREQLYREQLNQNVQQAIQELSGSDTVLMDLAKMQLEEQNQAWQLALQGAGLAARIQQLQG